MTDPYADAFNPEIMLLTTAMRVPLENGEEAVVAIDIDLNGLFFKELISKDLQTEEYEKWFLATKNHKVAAQSHDTPNGVN